MKGQECARAREGEGEGDREDKLQALTYCD